MPILDALTDDQIAMIGCAAALFLCGGLMVVSHSLRQMMCGGASGVIVEPSNSAGLPTEEHSAQRESAPDQRQAA